MPIQIYLVIVFDWRCELAAFAGSLSGQQEVALVHMLSAVLVEDTPQSPSQFLESFSRVVLFVNCLLLAVKR